MISQGDVWWADLPDPAGSSPGYRRPVLVIQGDSFNRSAIHTVVSVPLTGNLKWATAPGNVLLTRAQTGLARDSVANVSLVTAVDRSALDERAGKVSQAKLELVFAGLDLVLGR